MKNTMDDLRNHLFATIEALQDSENPMEVERAKAISQAAQTLVNAAKVEIAYLDLVGGESVGKFFPTPAHDGSGERRRSQLSLPALPAERSAK